MFKLTILGDIMFQKEMLSTKKYSEMFNNVKTYLNKSDLVIANIETPIAKSVNESISKKYQFLAPEKYVEELKNINISILSTANNHCLDNGKKGISETISILDELGIAHVGTYKNKEEERYIIKNIEGKKVCIIAYTYGTNAFINNTYVDKNDDFYICMLQNQELSNSFIRKIYKENNILVKIVRKLFRIFHVFQFNKQVFERKEKSRFNVLKSETTKIKKIENPDYIILLMHDGGQNNNKPIKRTINRINKIKKLGIDAIICNHEHMIHEVKVEDNKITTYSLGNFISTNGVINEPYDKMQDYSIGINIYFESDGKLKYTFTIFKITFNQKANLLQVNSLYDLILNEKNMIIREKLISDNDAIVSKVMKNSKKNEIKLEYDLKV